MTRRDFAARAMLAGLVLALPFGLSGCPAKRVIDYAIEARSADDIGKDNEIFVEVNEIMLDMGNIEASTEIYEQRLLITGLFDDAETYDVFRRRVQQVQGVRELLWHAVYMSKSEQLEHSETIIGWAEITALDTKAEYSLLQTKGVADVNMRVGVDAFGTGYVLGRARSAGERDQALAAVRKVEGIREVVDYLEVRP
ncbi:MAG: BON domain-containing protein [Rhodovibrionaceae bacterium]|nr:BON domain-containing protein [Rhodovibrionaceae bacterium]